MLVTVKIITALGTYRATRNNADRAAVAAWDELLAGGYAVDYQATGLQSLVDYLLPTGIKISVTYKAGTTC